MGGRLVDQFLRQRRITVNDAFELDDLDALEQLVVYERGVSLVPLVDAARTASRGLRVLPLGTMTFFREVGLVVRSDDDPSDPSGLARRLAAHLAREAVGRPWLATEQTR